MQRIAFCAAALAVFALAGAPAFAMTTEADFGKSGEVVERLLAKIHKHKKLHFVVKVLGGAGGDASAPPAPKPKDTGATAGTLEGR
jgi:hypothetical protein